MSQLSAEKHTLTLTGAAFNATANLTGTPDITDCVPFAMTRITATAAQDDSFCAYTGIVDLVAGTPDTVRLRTSNVDLSSREIVCEVNVVEFDPTEVTIQTGEASMVNGETSVTASITGVDRTGKKAWLYFTWTSDSQVDSWMPHTVRGRFTADNELTFDRGWSNDNVTIRWYVLEAIGSAWSVDEVSLQIAAAATWAQTSTFTAVTPNKAAIFGSHKIDGLTDTDNVQSSTADISLDVGNDQLTGTRLGTEGTLDWSGFVVEFGGAETVYRGNQVTSNASPDPAGHTSIGGTVDPDTALVHIAGSPGTCGGGAANDDSNSHDVPNAFLALTVEPGGTQFRCQHSLVGTHDAGSYTWEVIEWDLGGAPPAAARRVMVR